MTTSPEALPPVSRTAVGVAALRAAESSRPDRLFNDPYAAAFFAAGRSLYPADLTAPTNEIGALFYEQVAIRTRFYDDYLLAATAGECRQVVLLAAGLDTRAFRLVWPPDTTLFEVDLPDMLAFKAGVLAGQDAAPNCPRTVVSADLRTDWPGTLLAAGFRADLPTAWLAEGLLIYLTFAEASELVTRVAELSAPGSQLAFEHRSVGGDGLLEQARALRSADQVTQLWQGGLGVDAPDWLAEHGWQTSYRSRASLSASYGRRSEHTEDNGGFLTAQRKPAG